MKKAIAIADGAENLMAVSVVSFGNDPIALTLPVDSTVAQALAKAGIARGTSGVFVSGEEAEDGDILDAGDVVSVVSSKQAGA